MGVKQVFVTIFLPIFNLNSKNQATILAGDGNDITFDTWIFG
tara:strand:+ start:192 stop:317 length:126 start_codon:yes stop_codon:yes gene_type:complete